MPRFPSSYTSCGLQVSVWITQLILLQKSFRHLAVKNGEPIGISPLTSKRVKPINDSDVCHNLLN